MEANKNRNRPRGASRALGASPEGTATSAGGRSLPGAVPLHPQAGPAMSLVALPFYQRRHKHFDQSYRNTQARYLLSEYAARK